MTASPQPGNQDERACITAAPDGRPCSICRPVTIQRESVEDALENDRCGICLSVDHFREDCPRAAAAAGQTGAGEEADERRRSLPDEWEQMCGGSWDDEHAAKDQGPSAADSGALISDRRQGAARTVSPVATHRPERTTPALPAPSAVHVHVDEYDGVVNCDCSAPSAGQDADDRRCGRCGQIPYVHGLPDSTCVYEPTQAAGQDTGQMRDEIAEIVGNVVLASQQSAWEDLNIGPRRWGEQAAREVLDGPLRQLIAERDEARAQVQQLAAYFDGLADAARIVANVAEGDYGRGHAKGLSSGYRAAADHLRALDGET